MQFNFDNTYIKLPAEFFSRVQPTASSAPTLLAFNYQLAEELGIFDSSHFTDSELAHLFSGNKQLSGSEAIAQAYAGHQFGHFVPQLGDGRAMLLGEIITPTGKRLDMQLKGSGVTPYSRRGDGKSAIGPVLREYLVSEAMHRLGVPTTRALAAVATGDMVRREQMLPGAVMTRIAAGHIRIGTFQFFAARENSDAVKVLADYCIQRYCPEFVNSNEKYLKFFKTVCQRQMALIAQWMSFGFIHGVMNTDNMSISGETIDYGPCAFMDHFQFHKVFSSIDQQGRYSYSNQSSIAIWNLTRLAECLVPLIHENQNSAVEILETELKTMPAYFEMRWLERMAAKLGIAKPTAEDRPLIMLWLHLLEDQKLDFTNSFRQLPAMLTSDHGQNQTPAMIHFLQQWKNRLAQQSNKYESAITLMNMVNPVLIPRNHQIELVIAQAIEGNLDHFHRMRQALEDPFSENNTFHEFQLAPETHQCVQHTFCGT
jgi:uncharacterized protein YdiU (UPF0061 family)